MEKCNFPGNTNLQKKMRLKELIYQAGNLKRSAYLQEAEITRLIKTEEKVTSKILRVNLKEALQENPDHNILLEEDDYVFIRQIPNGMLIKQSPLQEKLNSQAYIHFIKGNA